MLRGLTFLRVFKSLYLNRLSGRAHHKNVTIIFFTQDQSSETKIVKNALRNVGFFVLPLDQISSQRVIAAGYKQETSVVPPEVPFKCLQPSNE